MTKNYIKRGAQLAYKSTKKTIKKVATPANIRKTLNTIGTVGSTVGKVALAAAIVSNPELAVGYEGAGWLAKKAAASPAAQMLFGQATKYGDKYFAGKKGITAKIYRGSTGVVKTGYALNNGDWFGAADQGLKAISGSGVLGKKRTEKFDKIDKNYLSPTLRAASGVHTMYRVGGAITAKNAINKM